MADIQEYTEDNWIATARVLLWLLNRLTCLEAPNVCVCATVDNGLEWRVEKKIPVQSFVICGTMFSSSNVPVVEGLLYDFDDEENALKWKGVFVASLHKVIKKWWLQGSSNWYPLFLRFWTKYTRHWRPKKMPSNMSNVSFWNFWGCCVLARLLIQSKMLRRECKKHFQIPLIGGLLVKHRLLWKKAKRNPPLSCLLIKCTVYYRR